MADGVYLLADRYYPADTERAPLVLLRTPYGRRSIDVLERLFVERGFQVLVVSLRGTAGSGGSFTGWTLEPSDGPALLAWLRDQSWFSGAFATWGASFLGYSQWALATEPIPEWRAAIITDAPSEVYETFMYRGGAFALKDWLGWAQQMRDPDRLGGASMLRSLLRMRADARRLGQATEVLPVTEADRAAVGAPIEIFQEWLRHPEPGPYWKQVDYRECRSNLPPVVYVSGGWRDIFLPGTLDDAVALRVPGREVRLRVGPWAHARGLFTRDYLRDVFAVLDYALRGVGELPSAPVRGYVTGAGEWREFDAWPPPGYEPRPYYPGPDGRLTTDRPVPGPPSRYRYDPADPTPASGGPDLRPSGRKDNREFEARPDVLTFTTPALPSDLDLIGPVTAELRVRSTLEHFDVVARVCDVAPNGRSTNVTEGIVRLNTGADTGPDGARLARVELWPIAHRLRAGHRIRLQVCGGAHPRYMRNLGTGDQLGTELRAGDQELPHDPERPSVLYLPARLS